MKGFPLFNRGYGAAVIGFGLYWAWVDSAFFMPTLYRPEAGAPSLPVLHLAVIACALIPAFVVLARRVSGAALLSRKVISAFAAAGTLGSFTLLLAGWMHSPVLVVLVAVVGGLGMGIGVLSWGRAVSGFGVEGASVCIPGTFVCAVLLGLLVNGAPVLVAQALAVLFPLGSASLLLVAAGAARAADDAPRAARPKAAITGLFADMPVHFLVILFLFCTAFGIMQYLLVLPHVDATAITAQNIAVRGVIASIVFVGFGLFSWKPDVAYKIGLLLITAGFMAAPFLKSIAFSSAIIMAGYTCFDMMGWIVVTAIIKLDERQAAGILALSRIAELGGVLCGGAAGALLVPWAWSDDANMAILTTAVAYLLVAVAVLLLYRGSSSVWLLMKRTVEPAASELQARELAVEELSARFCLTPRERDVLLHFAAGRSIPWIAQHFTISEGTVRSHTRHLYEKAGVHSRQELLDVLERQTESHLL